MTIALTDPVYANDREAFLRAIEEAPADLAPKLIYADWLDEQGEEELAKEYRADSVLVAGDTAAKNIKRVLKKRWPKIKFSVRTSTYGSVSVRWDCGPTTSQVNEIVRRHEDHTFDGQTDSSDYTPDEFTETYGGARSTFCSRDYGPDEEAKIGRAIQQFQGWGDIPNGSYRERIMQILQCTELGPTWTGFRKVEEENGFVRYEAY